MVVRTLGVTEQLLHGADIVAVFEQVRGERMPQGMASCRLHDAGPTYCARYRLLNGRFGETVPSPLPERGSCGEPTLGTHVLPTHPARPPVSCGRAHAEAADGSCGDFAIEHD